MSSDGCGKPRGKSWLLGSHLSSDSRKYLSGDPNIGFVTYCYSSSSDDNSDSDSDDHLHQQCIVNSEISVGNLSNNSQHNLVDKNDLNINDIPLDPEIRENMLNFLNNRIVREIDQETRETNQKNE